MSLKEINNLAQQVFTIIMDEYQIFLTKEKQDFLNNLDYDNFFKYKKEANIPFLTLANDSYYINNNYSAFEVVFMCLSLLCGELNPLKIELILLEVRKIIEKYNLSLEIDPIKDAKLGSIIQDGLLKDVPFNIIFFDSDIEIFNYLVSEKGFKTAKIYIDISNSLQKKVLAKGDFNPFTYLEIAYDLDYEDIYDELYNFINARIM